MKDNDQSSGSLSSAEQRKKERASHLRSDPLNIRRVVAIVALVGGLGLAWWTGKDDRHPVQVRLLLTHVSLQNGELVLGPQRLSSLVVRVPGLKVGDPPLSRRRWDFQPGRVPALSPLFEEKMFEDQPSLEIGCAFALSPKMQPLRTWTRVEVDLEREQVQVVDIGTCGELEAGFGLKPKVGE